MKRGQLCQSGADYLVEGLRRRWPFAAVGFRRFRSLTIINAPTTAPWIERESILSGSNEDYHNASTFHPLKSFFSNETVEDDALK